MEATIIIVDLNQVMLSNLMMQLGNHTNARVEENMVRHMVLNSLRSFRSKFYEEFGELVIACDNKNYWRRQVYPYYKANRKKKIAESEMDWNAIFECMNKIRAELHEFFPYKVINLEQCEADDIIATLIKHAQPSEKILILSGDKDFIQLQVRENVRQYDPVRKKFITHPDPKKYLMEHVLKGDSGDGIPNVLSDDDTFVTPDKRQKPLTQKKIDTFIHPMTGIALTGDMLNRNLARNRTLIDLGEIPQHIEDIILAEYNGQHIKGREKLMPYFITNKLKHLTEHLQEF
jgi:hypothetical protein